MFTRKKKEVKKLFFVSIEAYLHSVDGFGSWSRLQIIGNV